jgi:hypothetical protein
MRMSRERGTQAGTGDGIFSAQRRAVLDEALRSSFRSFENRLIGSWLDYLPGMPTLEQTAFKNTTDSFSLQSNPNGPFWEERALKDFHAELGRAKALLGQDDQARDAWLHVLAVEPWNEEARQALGGMAASGDALARRIREERTLILKKTTHSGLPKNPRDIVVLGGDRLAINGGEDNLIHIYDRLTLEKEAVVLPEGIGQLCFMSPTSDNGFLVGDRPSNDVLRFDAHGTMTERLRLSELLGRENGEFQIAWACENDSSMCLIVNGIHERRSHVYLMDKSTRTIQGPINNENPRNACLCITAGDSVIMDDHSDFWNRKIYRLPLHGGTPRQLPLKASSLLIRLAWNGSSLFATYDYHNIVKMDLDGTIAYWARIDKLTKLQHMLCGIAVVPGNDADTLYVIDRFSRLLQFEV